MYERVTGVEINTEDKLPKLLCWECVARLKSAYKFIEKSFKAHLILMKKLNSSNPVTLSDMQSINRAHLKLESSLGIKVSKDTDCNLYVMKENETDSCQFNDNDSNNKAVNEEKNPIKSEYLGIIEEQNVSTENYQEHIISFKDRIKFEDNICEEEMAIDNSSNVCEIEEENNVLRKAKEVSEEVIQNQMKIHHKVTPLKNRRSEALPHGKELRVVLEDVMLTLSKHKTQDFLKQLTGDGDAIIAAQSSKINKTDYRPQVKKKILEKEDNFQISKTANVASVSPGTVDSNISFMPNDTEISKNVFICDICGKEFYIKSTLIRHIREHPQILICEFCAYQSFFKHTFSLHVKSNHIQSYSFSCSLCSYKAYDNCALTRHVNAKHTKKSVYKCTYCNYKALKKSHLATHVNDNHTKTKVYNCSFCSFSTSRKCTLTAHVNAKHTKTDIYNCSYCRFKTSRKYTLSAHVNAKHT